ncbi:hypothetical protein X777_14922 [Ooceraea biroi]|uniref:Uncharacterized protein n=1 Tax=Ooceraea biroi TaxID=2015173 RepID=A0A026WS29_OOCBI|nr:hypothetical protein X777_14922 [Ooceraea biroi]
MHDEDDSNDRARERGEHEQRAYSRVKSHHSVTVGWSMERNLRDLLRHFSAANTCRTAGYLRWRAATSRSRHDPRAEAFEIPKRQGVRRNTREKKSAL